MATHIFANVPHTVSVSVDSTGLSVSVEDQLALDCWRGLFTKDFVEQLTMKTGSFKSFETFVAMLQAAVTTQGHSVSLDFVSYSFAHGLDAPGGGEDADGGRRYLVLTYRTEFDRVHFPLPLLQHSRPDPAMLQRTVRALQAELQQYKRVQARVPPPEPAREQGGEDGHVIGPRRPKQLDAGTQREIQVLRQIVSHLEEDMLAERTR
jgi:hypothetical protein